MSLQNKIETLKQEMSGQIPPDVQQAMQQAAEVLERSGISVSCLRCRRCYARSTQSLGLIFRFGTVMTALNYLCRQRM